MDAAPGDLAGPGRLRRALPLPPLEMGLAWHPRHDADPAHAWLRGVVRELLGERPEGTRPTQRA
ncbi:hypothetical protein GCM10010512_26170 [Streptomyces thermoviolaceus subsp. thermoviolaceus]|nr:hypothetical protein GCM10010512_26170 [Streptomyces thermoviolaceus subsp. thermoviolaceus]